MSAADTALQPAYDAHLAPQRYGYNMNAVPTGPYSNAALGYVGSQNEHNTLGKRNRQLYEREQIYAVQGRNDMRDTTHPLHQQYANMPSAQHAKELPGADRHISEFHSTLKSYLDEAIPRVVNLVCDVKVVKDAVSAGIKVVAIEFQDAIFENYAEFGVPKTMSHRHMSFVVDANRRGVSFEMELGLLDTIEGAMLYNSYYSRLSIAAWQALYVQFLSALRSAPIGRPHFPYRPHDSALKALLKSTEMFGIVNKDPNGLAKGLAEMDRHLALVNKGNITKVSNSYILVPDAMAFLVEQYMRSDRDGVVLDWDAKGDVGEDLIRARTGRTIIKLPLVNQGSIPEDALVRIVRRGSYSVMPLSAVEKIAPNHYKTDMRNIMIQDWTGNGSVATIAFEDALPAALKGLNNGTLPPVLAAGGQDVSSRLAAFVGVLCKQAGADATKYGQRIADDIKNNLAEIIKDIIAEASLPGQVFDIDRSGIPGEIALRVLLTRNVFFPVSVVLARPFIGWRMASIGLVEPGSIALRVTTQDSRTAIDVVQKYIKTHVTFYSNAAAIRPEGVNILPDVMFKEYIDGGGIRFCDPNAVMTDETLLNDIIPMAYDEKKSVALSLRHPIDITGVFANQDNGTPHFNTAPDYASHHEFVHGNGTDENIAYNTICHPEGQYHAGDDAQGNVVPRKCAIGGTDVTGGLPPMERMTSLICGGTIASYYRKGLELTSSALPNLGKSEVCY